MTDIIKYVSHCIEIDSKRKITMKMCLFVFHYSVTKLLKYSTTIQPS